MENKEPTICEFCEKKPASQWVGPCGEDCLNFEVCKKCADSWNKKKMEKSND